MDANFLKPQAWNTDPFWAHYHGAGNKVEVYISNQCPCSLGQAHPNFCSLLRKWSRGIKLKSKGFPGPVALQAWDWWSRSWLQRSVSVHRQRQQVAGQASGFPSATSEEGLSLAPAGLGDREHVYTRFGSRSHKNFNKFLGDFMLQEHIQGYLLNFLKIQCAFFMNFETLSTVLG